MARAIRLVLPKRLASRGTDEPFGFSNNKAGPPFRKQRSAISVISRLGSIAAVIRLSSPSCSSRLMNSRKSLKDIGTLYFSENESGSANYLRFIALKNSSLVLVSLSLSRINSVACTSSIELSSLRKIHMRCSSSSDVSKSSRRVPERLTLIAG